MKHMIIAFMTVLALAFTTFSVLAQTATIDEAEAIRIATDVVKQQANISEEDFQQLTPHAAQAEIVGHSGQVWVVSFMITLPNINTSVYSVFIEPHGTVIEADISADALEDAKRQNEGLNITAQLNEKYGGEYYWPMEETVALYRDYFDGSYIMPGEGDLTADEAIAIAKKYAIETWGLTQEYLDGLPVQALLSISEDADIGSMWYVNFIDESIRSKHDGILAPHMVCIDNPEGTVLYGWMGDTNGNG